jgi:hypothetical protein
MKKKNKCCKAYMEKMPDIRKMFIKRYLTLKEVANYSAWKIVELFRQ